MLKRRILWIAGSVMIAFGGVGAGPSSAQETLFERLGGLAFIECWIDRSLTVIARDKRIDDFFAGDLDIEDLRDSLVDFACAATGGPCTYSGRDMVCAHAGLGIGHGDFNAFIKDLEKGARRCGKNEPAYSELGKVLRSLRPNVVQDDLEEVDEVAEACQAT